MSKKSQEILYDSEVENVEAPQVEEQQPQQVPQNVPIVAPKPQRAPKAKVVATPQKESFICPLCSKTFARNYYLNRHIDDGRCNVKRNMELAKQKQAEEVERLLLDKLNKKAEREAKKATKAAKPPAKPAKKPPQTKATKAAPQQAPQQQQQQQQTHYNPHPDFIVNF